MLAEHAHETWAETKMHAGWSYGKVRNDSMKKHPMLVPYKYVSLRPLVTMMTGLDCCFCARKTCSQDVALCAFVGFGVRLRYLLDSEKAWDRDRVLETLRVIMALGYDILNYNEVKEFREGTVQQR